MSLLQWKRVECPNRWMYDRKRSFITSGHNRESEAIGGCRSGYFDLDAVGRCMESLPVVRVLNCDMPEERDMLCEKNSVILLRHWMRCRETINYTGDPGESDKRQLRDTLFSRAEFAKSMCRNERMDTKTFMICNWSLLKLLKIRFPTCLYQNENCSWIILCSRGKSHCLTWKDCSCLRLWTASILVPQKAKRDSSTEHTVWHVFQQFEPNAEQAELIDTYAKGCDSLVHCFYFWKYWKL